MTDYIWHLQQQSQIDEAKTDAAQAANRVAELEASLQRMTLVSQALWELLRDHFEIPEQELLDKINEIDLRDGVLDQRITPKVSPCPKCGRPVSAKNSSCYYCGAALKKPHVFQ